MAPAENGGTRRERRVGGRGSHCISETNQRHRKGLRKICRLITQQKPRGILTRHSLTNLISIVRQSGADRHLQPRPSAESDGCRRPIKYLPIPARSPTASKACCLNSR